MRIVLCFQSSARGSLPFGFRRQALAGPLAVRVRVLPIDVVDRQLALAGELASEPVIRGTVAGRLDERSYCAVVTSCVSIL